jgi:hypothetical protein
MMRLARKLPFNQHFTLPRYRRGHVQNRHLHSVRCVGGDRRAGDGGPVRKRPAAGDQRRHAAGGRGRRRAGALGATVHGTTVWLPDFTLASTGAAVGLFDRAEISYAHEWFDSRQAGGRLGIGNGYTFNLDILGLKLRVLGDAVYDQDRWLPQIAVGTELKQSSDGAVLRAVGARSDKGADFYAAMTKIFLTNANQFGLLGFGGDRSDSYHPEVEGSVAYLVSQSIAMGAELRTKPDNLRFAHEGAAFDVFGAYFLTKHASATLAYVGLGDIARQGAQNGVYLSIQVGF